MVRWILAQIWVHSVDVLVQSVFWILLALIVLVNNPDRDLSFKTNPIDMLIIGHGMLHVGFGVGVAVFSFFG